MVNLFIVYLLASTIASFFIILLFGVRKIVGKQIDRRWMKWVWIVFLLKLMIPIGLVDFSSFGDVFSAFDDNMNSNYEKKMMNKQDLIMDDSVVAGEENIELIDLGMIETSGEHYIYKATTIVSWIWLIVAIALLIKSIMMKRYAKYRHINNCNNISDNSLRLASEIMRNLGIKAKVIFLVSTELKVPMTIKIWKSNYIILPEEIENNYDDTSIKMVLVHELMHIKNWDMYLIDVTIIVKALHWFNPFAYIGISLFKNEIEMVCDIEVLDYIGKEMTYKYGTLMLNMVEPLKRHKESFALSMSGGGKKMKSRIMNLKKHSQNIKDSKIRKIAIILVVATVIIFGHPLFSVEGVEEPVIANDILLSAESVSISMAEIQKSKQNKTRIEESKEDLGTEKEDENRIEKISYMKPLENYRITSVYGPRVYGEQSSMHYGVDLASTSGSKIYAIASGIVKYSDYDDTNGYMIMIEHSDGYISQYAHCKETKVVAGDEILKGTCIGLVGSTGKSTGPHLHFGITMDGEYVDPQEILEDL